MILLNTHILGIYFHFQLTLFNDDLDLWGSGRRVLRGSSADLVDAAMLFNPRFFNPNLLSRHYHVINTRKSVPPPQYCIAGKIEFKLESSLGSHLLSNSFKYLNYRLLSRGKAVSSGLSSSFDYQEVEVDQISTSASEAYTIFSKSFFWTSPLPSTVIPTLEAMVVDFGPTFLVSALVNVASALPFEVVLDHQ